MVAAALATYRPERSARPLTVADLEDVRLLVTPELHRRRQRLDWKIDWSDSHLVDINGGPVRQALLNLLLNASAATSEGGAIIFKVIGSENELKVEIRDEGPGMPSTIARILTDGDPGPAVRAGPGLGLWMVRRTIAELGGKVTIATHSGNGTTVALTLPWTRQERAHAA